MNSKRLLEISKFISKTDSVIDVGCDHAYLSIYLKKNKLCKNVIASDISSNALEYAKKNIKKYNVDIPLYVSDGLKNINEYYDTVIISGMGTNTILNILDIPNKPRKIVLCSNNEHYKLRKELNKMGYMLTSESIIYENKHYYIIMNYLKGYQKLSNISLKYGISNNKEYFKYLYNKNKLLIKKANIKKKIQLIIELINLKYLIEKK